MPKKKRKKVSLIILDGFGINKNNKYENSIYLANTPNFDKLFNSGKYSSLEASGKYVGVLEGQMGNSEVGHITIGSGRIIKQTIVQANELFDNNEFENLDTFKLGISHVIKNNSRLHIMGLIGPGGVHASSQHIRNIISIIPKNIQVYLHIFGDGRDTNYKSLKDTLEKCNTFLKDYENVSIASISGRFYSMDRDNNWDRIKKSYNVIVNNGNLVDEGIIDYIFASYEKGIYDEFIEPASFIKNSSISSGDGVFFVNFRSDRARQITQAITNDDFPSVFILKKINDLYFATMTKYYENYKGRVFIEKNIIKNTLPEILNNIGLNHLHMAETEKFAHVTKFFAGGNNLPYDNQKNILIPSPKVKTYDLKPEMSAIELFEEYKKNTLKYDFTVINFANGDMVGHSGKLSAGIKAVEILDKIVGELIDFSLQNSIDILITADHGNCEEMGTKENPHTSHTLNKVPCFYISSGELQSLKKEGGLKDITPTILDIMGINKLDDMTGNSLIK